MLKDAHLRRCPHPSSLRRTGLYVSLLGISGALYLNVFGQTARRVLVGGVDSGLRSQLVFVHGHEGHERLGDEHLLFRSPIKDLRLPDNDL